MTAEKTRQDELLDLLYGELSPQEEAEVRAAIEADEGLREAWEELQADREVVIAAVPAALEVPEEVTAAILERGRVKKPGRRSPAGRGAGKSTGGRGIWYDVTMGRYKAPVSVAVVLLCVGVVFTILRGEVEEAFSPAQEEVSAIQFGDGGPAAPKSVGQRGTPTTERPVDDLDAVEVAEERSLEEEAPTMGQGSGFQAEGLAVDEAPAPRPQESRRAQVGSGRAGMAAPVERDDSVALGGSSGVQSRNEAPRAAPEEEAMRRPAARSRASAPSARRMERAVEPQVSEDSMEMLDWLDEAPAGASAGAERDVATRGAAVPSAPAEEVVPDAVAPAPETRSSANVDMQDLTEGVADAEVEAEQAELADEPAPTASERLEEAEEALAEGRVDEARELIDGLEAAKLTEAEQERLQDVQEALSEN